MARKLCKGGKEGIAFPSKLMYNKERKERRAVYRTRPSKKQIA